ncbi:flagellar basal body protein FliL [Syntrophotalea acetylenivorans]|uniref:Flagellar protein FliL n=1 Tax=Syntrophotalea acetylenivorans TaxID=1842532 RepID=A0A1L3GN11_9BACT|nr:flagellar basal body-associated FliL family protein [Syntrophotalea acetylenivorans]APG27326.1 flagellar basal body protein FliL [Syntrophotalea acetylenivorans]
MADKETSTEAGAEKKSKKMLFIIIAAAVLLLGGGAAAFFLLKGDDPNAAALQAPDAAPTTTAPSAAGAIGPMVEIEPFIINILDEEGTRYLKAAITLEANNEPVVEEITQRMPQIRDAILLLVGNKTFGELADLQGKLQLRSEIRERLNKILTGGRVQKIYFTEFVVQ